MEYIKKEEIYRGKAKSVYATDDPDHYIMLYRDDTSAFDGKVIKQLERKGRTNNQFSFFIMKKLEAAGIPVHCEKLLSPTETLVKKLKMVPVECVVRNLAAGSLVRRLGVVEGQTLNPPTFEFFLKNDALHDPMVNDSHVLAFGWGTQAQIDEMKSLSLRINAVLKELFEKAGLLLADFKLEFGLYKDQLMLGDEFSPDGCRLWDAETRNKLDKDRFRQNLGNVIEGYEEVARRIGCTIYEQLPA